MRFSKFIQLWNTFHEPEQVPLAFQTSLDNLNLTYVDLYLLHWPMAFDRHQLRDTEDEYIVTHFENGTYAPGNVDYVDTWRAMEKLVDGGKVRSIGLANFNSQQIDRILSVAKIRPVVNQVECNILLNQLPLIDFCAKRKIIVQATIPLTADVSYASSLPIIVEIAKKHDRPAVHVMLRYLVMKGIFYANKIFIFTSLLIGFIISVPKSSSCSSYRNIYW